MNAIPPSSPSRRHFIGIAAAAGRKLAMISVGDETWMTLGSANFTRRNIDDYNLEANVALQMARTAPLAGEVIVTLEPSA
mgnify:CR=1 FL=1